MSVIEVYGLVSSTVIGDRAERDAEMVASPIMHLRLVYQLGWCGRQAVWGAIPTAALHTWLPL